LHRKHRRIGIRQQQPQRFRIELEQHKQRDDAPFWCQPPIPLPMAWHQPGDLVHELRLRKGRRIATA